MILWLLRSYASYLAYWKSHLCRLFRVLPQNIPEHLSIYFIWDVLKITSFFWVLHYYMLYRFFPQIFINVVEQIYMYYTELFRVNAFIPKACAVSCWTTLLSLKIVEMALNFRAGHQCMQPPLKSMWVTVLISGKDSFALQSQFCWQIPEDIKDNKISLRLFTLNVTSI